MPDNQTPLPPQNQIDWHGMLHDLEKNLERLSDAMDGVRMSVRRIVMAEAWLPQAAVEQPSPSPKPVVTPEAVAEQPMAMPMPPVVVEPAPQLPELIVPVQATESEEDPGEAVGRALEDARAELQPGPVSISEAAPPAWSEEEEREAVRRAVEQAKSEMAGGRLPDLEEAPLAARPMPQRPINPQHLLPTLTIEDPESRVELSRVYGLLQRLGIAAQASLLNYTSRQVSVMLGPDAASLTTDDYVRGVGATMGRESTARQDGANVIVELRGAKVEAA